MFFLLTIISFFRTEQQFHPEIYKSTKCNDIQNTSYCPRGAFCAFAHIERKFLVVILTYTDKCTPVVLLPVVVMPITYFTLNS